MTPTYDETLIGLLDEAGVDGTLRPLVQQYLELPDLNHTGRGMAAGGALSPLPGALYMDPPAVGRAGWTGLPGRRRQTLCGLRPQTIADQRHPITAGVRDRRSMTGSPDTP